MIVILKKAFHDTRRSMLWLAFGLGLYAFLIMGFYPTMVEQSADFDKMIQSYPDELMSLFYSGDPEEMSVSNPGTYVGMEFGLWMILIMGAMVIALVFNATTNAERDGTLDLILCLPITRRQMLAGRALHTALYILIILATCWAAFILAMIMWPEFDPDLLNLTLGVFGAILPLMVVAGFTTMLATLIPSSKHYAGGLAYLFLMGSYLLHSFSGMIDPLKWVRPLMLFDYFDTGKTIREGAVWSDWLVLAVVAAVYFAVAWWAIDRKELGV